MWCNTQTDSWPYPYPRGRTYEMALLPSTHFSHRASPVCFLWRLRGPPKWHVIETPEYGFVPGLVTMKVPAVPSCRLPPLRARNLLRSRLQLSVALTRGLKRPLMLFPRSKRCSGRIFLRLLSSRKTVKSKPSLAESNPPTPSFTRVYLFAQANKKRSFSFSVAASPDTHFPGEIFIEATLEGNNLCKCILIESRLGECLRSLT